MIKEVIEKLINGQDLSRHEATRVIEYIMAGEATSAQISAFVVAMRIKGETVEEITGLAQVMRNKSLSVYFDGLVVDTCGTGGDGMGTFNISTCAAFVVAGAGLTVAKHGNRAMTSRCGSADILEHQGVKIDLGPEGIRKCLEEVGIGFMFAPIYHPAMKHAAQPRRELGVRTVFNILGPLTNPAGAKAQVLGVAVKSLGSKMIRVLNELGSSHAIVVNGENNLDEISISSPTNIWELKDGKIREYCVSAEEFGIKPGTIEQLYGGSAEENTIIMRNVLNGVKGAHREAVIINAAAGIVAGNIASTMTQGVEIAVDSIDSGRSLKKLNALVDLSQRLA